MNWIFWLNLIRVVIAGHLVIASTVGVTPRHANPSAAPCASEIVKGVVCEAANQHALALIRSANLAGITLVQNVRTGELVAFAATDPLKLDVSSPILPLSIVKLMLAASWWEHGQPEQPIFKDESGLSVHDMIVTGRDLPGRKMASALRKSIGTKQVQKDLEKYGFPSCSRKPESRTDERFWGQLSSTFRPRLVPAASYTDLCNETSDADWEYTLSIGEARFVVTALHISRFLQAIGNDGIMLTPAARSSATKNRRVNETRVMKLETARKLQSAMRDVVRRGTATSIANSLSDTGWNIGGKTGSMGAPIGPQSDGWFAGLVFDAKGQARFTVATFLKHGGPGGGNAAKVSAKLARYLIGEMFRSG